MSRYLFGWSIPTLTMALACLSGCQTANQTTRHTDIVSAAPTNEKLGPHQVADVQVALARTQEQQGEAGTALNTYLEALKQDPNRADACLRVAALLDQQGQFEKAQEYYRRALTAQPRNPDVHCNLGYSLYLQQRWSEAETAFRQALALDKDHRRAHNNLGLVLAQTGRSEEALAEFRKAGCGEAAAHTNLAFALTLGGRWPEARTQYEQALTADPSSVSAKKRLQELTLLQAKAEQAAPVVQTPESGARNQESGVSEEAILAEAQRTQRN